MLWNVFPFLERESRVEGGSAATLPSFSSLPRVSISGAGCAKLWDGEFDVICSDVTGDHLRSTFDDVVAKKSQGYFPLEITGDQIRTKNVGGTTAPPYPKKLEDALFNPFSTAVRYT